ncbi:MAG: cache domain-containing protein [Candidatus Omnitrophica bacterium]|nr:cache domain-containing protein [Candidatus Omnitrophota bacterium]
MKKLIMLFVGIIIFVTASAFATDVGDIMPSLKAAKQAVDTTLAEIGTDIQAAAKALSGTDLKGDAARKILNDLRKYRPYVIDCSIIDPNGIKITVEPAEYKQYEGQNRSDLPHVMSLLKNKKPVMSNVYHSAEGIHAVTVGYPIFSDKGEFLGAVRMLIRHEDFLKPLVEDKPCRIWIIQKNGLIVYDADPEEIGKNMFSDPIFSPFEDLISFSKTVVASKNGAGSYSFYVNAPKDKTLAEKIAVWDTVGLYGTEWRVVAMEINKKLDQPAAAAPAK